jgi:hypothetical protein
MEKELLPNSDAAINEEGDVLPPHDVFPDLGISEEDDSLLAPNIEVPLELTPDTAIGATAVELTESQSVIDAHPDQATPSEQTRLRFAHMTSELFETMKNDDKRFVALSIYLANKRHEIGPLPEGMVGTARAWLYDDRARTAKYKSYPDKHWDIVRAHKKAGDSTEPWAEIFQGKFNGEMANKARLRWDKDYCTTMKNQYYTDGLDYGFDIPPAEPPLIDVGTRPMSPADAFDQWQREQEDEKS